MHENIYLKYLDKTFLNRIQVNCAPQHLPQRGSAVPDAQAGRAKILFAAIRRCDKS
jgi:hypothetical protein